MKKGKKKNNWIKFRHKVIRVLFGPIFALVTKLKYNAKITKFKAKKGENYLIISNHQTAFDQFFVSLAFKMPVYYIASEDLFSKGFISTLLKYAVAPIPIKKQVTDVRAVMNCLRVAKEGGTISLFPEGNRTFSGKTEYINPSIGGLIKALKLPIVFFKIEGGYGVQPRWSDVTRRGQMRAYPSKVMQYEEYKDFTNEQVYELVCKELYVNEASVSGEFYHKKSAEYLERTIHVCPKCGFSEFESNGKIIRCKKCNLSASYLPTKQFKGVDSDFPFEFVNDWYDYQTNFINNFNPADYYEKPAFCDEVSLFEVIIYKNKKLIQKGVKVSLFGNRIELDLNGNTTYNFDDLSGVSVLGKNKLNIYLHNGELYQFKGNKRFNAVKYVQLYYRYKNVIKEGNVNAQSKHLGL